MNYKKLDKLSNDLFFLRKGANFGEIINKPKNLTEAYYIQHSNYARLGEVGGWKLGGSTSASRNFFNVDGIYYGPIFKEFIYSYKSIIHISPCDKVCLGELEIVFYLSSEIERYMEKEVLHDNAIKYIASFFPAIEMPNVMFPIHNDSLAVVVADQCVSGWLILGDEIPFSEDVLKSTNNVLATLVSNKNCILNGTSSEIIGGPFNVFCDFLKLAQKHRLKLCPGQYVATGAFSKCESLPLNSLLKADFSGLGSFYFTIND
ncbi:TPA: hypothetical protein RQM97_000362 [Aeromonas dhakensis]|nr:hypothetical protein [Aeromonas dhakensis]